jgi:hypothetical protein
MGDRRGPLAFVPVILFGLVIGDVGSLLSRQ